MSDFPAACVVLALTVIGCMAGYLGWMAGYYLPSVREMREWMRARNGGRR
jgi:hypothetical protein